MRAPITEPVQGALIGEDGSVQEATALHNPKGAGDYTDTVTGKPLPNFVPGKVGEGTIETLAKATSTNNLIDRALASLAPVKDDNSIETTQKIFAKYLGGTAGDDPVTAAIGSLTSLAKLQSSNSAALGGRSRAMAYVIDTQRHLPIAPSARETGFIQRILPAGISVEAGKQFENSPAWDSPAAMYQKLELAKTNNNNFIRELKAGLGKTAERTAAGGAGGGAGAAGPVQWVRDPATGKLVKK
jgi:hypothetical protein